MEFKKFNIFKKFKTLLAAVWALYFFSHIQICQAEPRFQFGITIEERNHRIMITSVDRTSKAFESGLRRGDFVLGINGRRVTDLEDLKRTLSRVGNKSLFYISRQGYKKEVLIKFREDFIYDAGTDSYNIGLSIEEVEEGLYVKTVKPNSVAYEGGLDPGDIIVGANGYRVRKVPQLRQVLDQQTQGEVTLFVKREGRRYKTKMVMDPKTLKKGMAPRKGSSSSADTMSSKPNTGRMGSPVSAQKEPANTQKNSNTGSSNQEMDYDKLLEKFSSGN